MKQGVWASLALGIAVATASLAMTGCCGGGKKGVSGSSIGTTGELVSMPTLKAQFNAPGGWSKRVSGDWTVFSPPDKTARLAFVTFNKPGESTTKIGQIAHALDLGAVSFKSDAKSSTIGKGAFPSREALGSCNFTTTGVPCELWYATVNTGQNDQLLVVYAVNTTGDPTNKNNSQAAVQSLSRM